MLVAPATLIPAPASHSASAPAPVLLYRRGIVAPNAVAALAKDARIEIFSPDELTPEWVSFGRRAAACIVATTDDPFHALTFAILAGLRHVVLAVDRRHAPAADALIDAGAHACITTPLSSADVDALIASFRPNPEAPQVAGALHLALDPLTRTIRHGDRVARLTQREFALLHCLVSHGRPVSAEHVLRTAWGDNPKVANSRQVLEVYVHQLRKKLAQVGLDGVLHTVRGFGYAIKVR